MKTHPSSRRLAGFLVVLFSATMAAIVGLQWQTSMSRAGQVNPSAAGQPANPAALSINLSDAMAVGR